MGILRGTTGQAGATETFPAVVSTGDYWFVNGPQDASSDNDKGWNVTALGLVTVPNDPPDLPPAAPDAYYSCVYYFALYEYPNQYDFQVDCMSVSLQVSSVSWLAGGYNGQLLSGCYKFTVTPSMVGGTPPFAFNFSATSSAGHVLVNNGNSVDIYVAVHGTATLTCSVADSSDPCHSSANIVLHGEDSSLCMTMGIEVEVSKLSSEAVRGSSPIQYIHKYAVSAKATGGVEPYTYDWTAGSGSLTLSADDKTGILSITNSSPHYGGVSGSISCTATDSSGHDCEAEGTVSIVNGTPSVQGCGPCVPTPSGIYARECSCDANRCPPCPQGSGSNPVPSGGSMPQKFQNYGTNDATQAWGTKQNTAVSAGFASRF